MAWLEKTYGDLADAEDYQYLINILETAYHQHSEPFYKKELALQWLRDKLKQAVALPAAFKELGLQWNTPRIEFVELMYALFEAGVLKITSESKSRAKAIDRLGEILQVEGKEKIDSVLQNIKKRNSDRQTPLLDRLKESLSEYINRE